jgi:hypothetical protein
MSDATPDTGTDAAPDATIDTKPDTGDATDWKAEAEKWQALAKKHEGRAKANADAAKELEQFREQSMTEAERAIAQARQEARTAALAEMGGKIAAAEIRAAAAGRLAPQQLDALLDGIDTARFLTDDGDVDRDKVAKFVDGIAPPADEDHRQVFPDLGQGARGNGSQALNGDPLLRDLKATLGVR